MDQLDGITIPKAHVADPGATDDFPVQFHHDHARIERQMRQQIGDRRRPGNGSRLAVHHDSQFAQRSPLQPSSMAIAAWAGSGASHSALMLATP